MATEQLGFFDAPIAVLPHVSTFGKTSVEYARPSSLLTPASGFMNQYQYTLNPYSGCGFGCDYCYARFFASSQVRRDTWGEWVTVKENSQKLIQNACRNGKLKTGDAVYMSSVTDPYQPIEQQMGLTRSLLTTILAEGVQPRLTIQTRSPIATRDIDLFQQFESIRVNFTVTTDSEEVRLRYEPHCPSIENRLKAAAAVAAAGVKIGLSISPMLPLTDPQSFAARLASLDADEYVTQYLKPARSRFSAGSTAEALDRIVEDKWTLSDYQNARHEIQKAIGDKRLHEGAEGYAPA